jgi:hypothetical protein
MPRPTQVVFWGTASPDGNREKAPRAPRIDRWAQAVEQGERQLELWARKVGIRLITKKQMALMKAFHARLMPLDPQSSGFIRLLVQGAEQVAKSSSIREMEMNTESGRLQQLTDSDEACIFILNHDNQWRDPAMLGFFIDFLYRGYLNAGKAETCPRPTILLNEDIVDVSPKKLQEIYDKIGIVGVDPSLFDTAAGRSRNSERLRPVLQGFYKDQRHVFIFPEGKLAGFTDASLEQRFQNGIGDLIRLAARNKKRVKVVPLGFAYPWGLRKRVAAVQIGEPVYFMRRGQELLVSAGNLTPENTTAPYQRFFFNREPEPGRMKRGLLTLKSLVVTPKVQPPYTQPFEEIDGERYKVITQNGKPVTGKPLKQLIAHIAYENLRVVRNEAKKSLPKGLLREKAQFLPNIREPEKPANP